MAKKELEIIGCHLGFRTRTVNALLRGATWELRDDNSYGLVEGAQPIKTLNQLAACTVRDILRLKGAGKHTLWDCEKILRAHGYSTKDSRLLQLIDGGEATND